MSHSNALEQQRLAKFAEIARDPARLTDAQADGTACVFCGAEFGPMVVVGIINRVQMFGHESCPVPAAEVCSLCNRGERFAGDRSRRTCTRAGCPGHGDRFHISCFEKHRKEHHDGS